MTSKKLYYILVTLVVVLAASLIGGAYGANSILASQSQDLLQARSKSTALEQQQIELSTARSSITKYKAVGDIARSVVPQDKDQAQTVREIVKIASESGISLGAITFPTSTLGTGAAAPTPGAPAPAPTPANTTLSQLKPAVGLTGVYTLQITVQSNEAAPTKYDKFVEFMAGLEKNRRTALVSSIILQPDAKDPSSVSFTLTIDEYIKP